MGETITIDDLFSVFEGLDGVGGFSSFTPPGTNALSSKEGKETLTPTTRSRLETHELQPSPKSKRPKLAEDANKERTTHIVVERNRRKQMNEHLSVLRSLMPYFYVKRGDQASIIGGVVDYINELQEMVQTLEAKKQRHVVYKEVVSPRKVSPMAMSPRTPQPRLHRPCYNGNMSSSLEPSPSSSSSNGVGTMDNELVANSRSVVADVKVKFSGSNLLLKTVSPRIPGQALKIVTVLEGLALETLHLNISTVDDTMLVNSFTVKIGIECQLSVEELAQQIQQTFAS